VLEQKRPPIEYYYCFLFIKYGQKNNLGCDV
jgi:hypothetical protein